jgi:acetyl esterase/lipase
MPLDPYAKRLLDMLAMTSSVDALSLSVNDRRDLFRKLMSLSASNVPISRIENRALPGPEGPINIRIYTPIATVADQLPGLVYFHGGGLVAGSLDTHDSVCRTLANESGCRLISVDYRLAPEHKFPAAVMDSYKAAIWAVEHAAELGIDRARIAVAGDSAGATLAAIVCQLARRARRVHLAAQLLLCPITDFAAEAASRSEFAEGYLLDKAIMDRDLEHYLPVDTDPADPRISPLRASQLSELPPAYVHTAEFDPVRDEGRAYADKLACAGVDVNYTCHLGMIHLFYGMAGTIPYASTALKRVGSELRAALG